MSSMATSNSSSNSFSNLLKRTKLVKFNSKIDQIYTTNQSNLIRSNFGLKSNIPLNLVKASPFIKITNLDNEKRRTQFRKSTKEFSFLKKFEELNVKINLDGDEHQYSNRNNNNNNNINNYNSMMNNNQQFESVKYIKSRTGELKRLTNLDDLISSTSTKKKSSSKTINEKDIVSINLAKQSMKLPNYLDLPESNFEQFLLELSTKKAEFQSFLTAQEAEDKSKVKKEKDYLNPEAETGEIQSVDLYKSANLTSSPNLTRNIEKFLLSLNSIPSTSLSSTTSTHPSPMPHPSLGLQYSPPTSLESIRSPSIPGRILGPAPSSPQSNSNRNSQNSTLSLLLSTVSTTGPTNTAGASSTTFFPDSDGIRDSKVGRNQFRIEPVLKGFASGNRFVGIESSRGNKLMMNTNVSNNNGASGVGVTTIGTKGQQSTLLSLYQIDLKAKVVDSESSALPGSQSYSGNLPVASTSSYSSMNKYESLLTGAHNTQISLLKQSNNSNSSARDETARRLREDRLSTDGKAFAPRSSKLKGMNSQVGGGKKSKNKNEDLLSSLKGLLDME